VLNDRVLINSWPGPRRIFKLVSKQTPSVSESQAFSLLNAQGRACYRCDRGSLRRCHTGSAGSSGGGDPVHDGTIVFRRRSGGEQLVEVGVWTTATGSGVSTDECHMLWIERLSHGEAVYETAVTNSAANAEAEKCIKNNIESVTRLLIHLPNSRKNEHEADLIGLKLAAIAGYPLTAGIDAIKALDSLGKGQAPNAMVTRMVGQHYNHAHAEIFKYL